LFLLIILGINNSRHLFLLDITFAKPYHPPFSF